MTLRRRLALVSAIAVAVVVVCGSVIAYVLVERALSGEIDRSLHDAVAEAPLPPAGTTFMRLATEPLEGPEVALRVLGPDAADDSSVREAIIEGRRVRILSARTSAGDVIQAARPLAEMDAVLGDLRVGLGLLVVIGIAGAALLGRAAARTAVAPVAELTTAAEHVAATQDLSRRIEASGDDELGRLARSFNTMLSKLDDSRQAQRRLVADVSHELRTPLTSLRTNLEVLAVADGLDERDRDRLRADLVAQLEELGALVGDLVALAREEEAAAPEPTDVRLDELVLAGVGRARRHRPDVRFVVDAEPAVVRGDPGRLDRAVGNLLDNAAKFGGAHGPVEVEVTGAEVRVRDHGPGIPAADAPHVFERFYRSDSARGTPGSGLGLAIVKQIATAHGGSVLAEPAPGGGTRMRLLLNS